MPDRDRIAQLRGGDTGLREPGLPELIDERLARLGFAAGAAAALAAPRGAAEVVVLCVPTPVGADELVKAEPVKNGANAFHCSCRPWPQTGARGGRRRGVEQGVRERAGGEVVAVDEPARPAARTSGRPG